MVRAEAGDVIGDVVEDRPVVGRIEHPDDPFADGLHLLALEPARGHTGRPDADPAGDERRAALAGDGVLVHDDVDGLEGRLSVLARQVGVGVAEVDEQEVFVRAARDEREAVVT